MRRIARITAAAALLLVAGCATDQRNQTLTATLNAYASTVRWGNLANAEQFVDPAIRNEHPLTPIELSRFTQYRVSDYDDGSGPVATGENEVKQVVHIGIVNVHTQVERTLVDRQTWKYDPQAKHWWLTTGLPDLEPAQ
ncbi:hypothetical protein ATSB10_33580 [Dyella thiooxydans]|uniref:Lipoprotein n=1 Tax=Dyella thiooxydans TaxID=445710 RepID=A0A160N5F3_9GAMM|nr:hypothetical protein [Dyella thiooxydans]AND70812.1 hypothetical protein ATSB10_33580 [Dyella thiooxydans]